MKTQRILIQVDFSADVPADLTPEQLRGIGINVDPAAVRVMADFINPIQGASISGHTTTAVLDENGEEV